MNSESRDELIAAAEVIQRQSFIRVAIVTVFFYNLVLTSGDEVRYVWGRSGSVARTKLYTVFYLITRYLSAIMLIYVSTSWNHEEVENIISYPDPLGSVVTYVGACILFCSMVLLQIRTYALFESRKTLFWVFLLADVLSIIVSCVSAPTVAALFVYEPQSIYDQAVYSNAPDGLSLIYYVPFFLLETMTFVLVLYKSWKLRYLSCGKRSIVSIMIKHGIIYYLIIFTVHTGGLSYFNRSLWTEIGPYEFEYLLFGLSLSGILAPNLFLELRKSYHETTCAPSQGMLTISLPVFHENLTHRGVEQQTLESINDLVATTVP